MRKLVTVQVVTGLFPIEGADRIERATVLGWNVVVPKGEFQVGEKVAYFEVDSLLNDNNAAFEAFQKRGKKTVIVDGVNVSGHVLKTAKLRGVFSQGLIMGLNSFGFSQNFRNSLQINDTLDDVLGVVKWEEPIPVAANIIGPFDTSFAPKTEATRIQTLSDHWDEIVALRWVPTVKVDGTSQTIVNDNGRIRLFGRNWELSTDSAGYLVAEKFGIVDVLKDNPGMAVQFELAGENIQSNRLRISGKRPFVFAVWSNQSKVAFEDWDTRLRDVAAPVLSDEWQPSGSLEEMIEKVSGLRGNVTKGILDEGVVFHLDGGQEQPYWAGTVANFKIISNKYLVKYNI